MIVFECLNSFIFIALLKTFKNLYGSITKYYCTILITCGLTIKLFVLVFIKNYSEFRKKKNLTVIFKYIIRIVLRKPSFLLN